MTYTPLDFFQDIANQASVDRAGNWLLLAQADYPWLFQAITKNLSKPPDVVLEQIKTQAAQSKNLIASMMVPQIIDSTDKTLLHAFIGNLQTFFKEKGF